MVAAISKMDNQIAISVQMISNQIINNIAKKITFVNPV